MYIRILVPLDGSQLAEGILPYARSFAKTLKIPVELLYVIDPEALIPSVVAQHGRYHEVLGAERKYGTNYVKQVATSFLDSSSIDCSVEIGRPAEVIVDRAAAQAGTLVALEGEVAEKIIGLARERPESLLAMCTHGRTGVGRWVLGSATDRVVRHSGDPVLVIRAGAGF